MPATPIPVHPLRDYAFCGDGERGMILGPDGTISWMCAPHWDSDAVFSALLGGRGGFSVTPRATPRISGGEYEPRSLVWRHRWTTAQGPMECRDALAYPGDDHRAIILRRIESEDGEHVVDVHLAPLAGFGSHGARDARCADGVWTWRTGDLWVRAVGLADATMSDDGELAGAVVVPAHGTHDLVVEISDEQFTDALDPDALWDQTRAAWQRAVPAVTGTAADSDVARFYAVANGLMSRHGGMVAAATTALPERLTGSRNYDYRYAWVRDQCFVGLADAAYGGTRLLDSAVTFIGERLHADGADLRPAYTVRGERVPDERGLDLVGYPGATPIVGNHANVQFQLDAFGEALVLFAHAARVDRLDERGWEAARIAADAIRARWDEPDAGIWELENRWWTHSRLACVAGLRLAAAYAAEPDARSWRDLADVIEARVSDVAVTPAGTWARAADDDGLDAALLLPAIRGGIDPRATANQRTVDAVLTDLVRDAHLVKSLEVV